MDGSKYHTKYKINPNIDFEFVACNITGYNSVMIVSFQHKGLQQYYEEGNGAKVPTQYLGKINRILDQLDAITSESDIQQMGSGIHKLTGDMADFWSIKVSSNYRTIFRFDNAEVSKIDYLDYQ